MFKNSFQGGPSLEVFSPQGSSSALVNWKVTTKSAIQRQYEKEIKGYCYAFTKNGKIQLPKQDKQTAYLLYPFLVLQCYLPLGASMSIELGLTDLNNNKRRFIISSGIKEYKNTLLHVMLPLSVVKRGVWLNLCFDLVSLMSDCFKGQTFRSLDTITLTGTFRLRKIFSMKSQPPDTTGEYDFAASLSDVHSEAIPKHLQFPFGVEYLTQVLTLPRMCEHMEKMPSDVSPRDSKYNSMVSSASSMNSIAFGRRIEHPLPPLQGISKMTMSKPQTRSRTQKPSPLTSRAATASPADTLAMKPKAAVPPITRLPPPSHTTIAPKVYQPERYQDEEIVSADEHLRQEDFPVKASSVVLRAAHHRSRSHSRQSSQSSEPPSHVITSITEQQPVVERIKEESFDDDSLSQLQSQINEYMQMHDALDQQDRSMAPAAESHDRVEWVPCKKQIPVQDAMKKEKNPSSESLVSNISNSWQHDKAPFIKNLSQLSLPPSISNDHLPSESTRILPYAAQRPATTPTAKSPRKVHHRPLSAARQAVTQGVGLSKEHQEWGGVDFNSISASDPIVDECVTTLIHTLRAETSEDPLVIEQSQSETIEDPPVIKQPQSEAIEEPIITQRPQSVYAEQHVESLSSHQVTHTHQEPLYAQQSPALIRSHSVYGESLVEPSHVCHTVEPMESESPLLARTIPGLARAKSVYGEISMEQVEPLEAHIVSMEDASCKAVYQPERPKSVHGQLSVSHLWPEKVENVELESPVIAQSVLPRVIRSSSSRIHTPLATIPEDQDDEVRVDDKNHVLPRSTSESDVTQIKTTNTVACEEDAIQNILSRSLESLRQLKVESLREMGQESDDTIEPILETPTDHETEKQEEDRGIETAKSASLLDKSNELVIEVSDDEGGDETLELLYDSDTGLYYDPITNKYYELNQ